MRGFGWEAGIRTPIPRSRAACPTVGRLPSTERYRVRLPSAPFDVKAHEMAEREGFEPSAQAQHPCNCLAGSPVQPLQHLSVR
jgi:hypothetical protein